MVCDGCFANAEAVGSVAAFRLPNVVIHMSFCFYRNRARDTEPPRRTRSREPDRRFGLSTSFESQSVEIERHMVPCGVYPDTLANNETTFAYNWYQIATRIASPLDKSKIVPICQISAGLFAQSKCDTFNHDPLAVAYCPFIVFELLPL